jgi:hypothetical protein
MTIDSFLENASKVYDFVILDLVALSTSDISRETAVKSDVVVITAAQDVALYGDVRGAVEWIVAGGVPAVTTVLNFAQPDLFKLRFQQFTWITGGKFSEFHDWFRNWIAGKEAQLFEILAKSPRYKKLVEWLQQPSPPTASTSKDENKTLDG